MPESQNNNPDKGNFLTDTATALLGPTDTVSPVGILAFLFQIYTWVTAGGSSEEVKRRLKISAPYVLMSCAFIIAIILTKYYCHKDAPLPGNSCICNCHIVRLSNQSESSDNFTILSDSSSSHGKVMFNLKELEQLMNDTRKEIRGLVNKYPQCPDYNAVREAMLMHKDHAIAKLKARLKELEQRLSKMDNVTSSPFQKKVSSYTNN